MYKVCECGGSGDKDCSKSRHCWRMLPNMTEVADKLKERYEHSVHSKILPSSAQSQHPHIVHVKTLQKVHPNKMIHFKTSPNYCTANAANNIKGTAGRDCTLDKDHASSSHHCNNLCCDHGYEEYQKEIPKFCCKVVWCCKLKCKTCIEHKTRHRCKSNQ